MDNSFFHVIFTQIHYIMARILKLFSPNSSMKNSKKNMENVQKVHKSINLLKTCQNNFVMVL